MTHSTQIEFDTEGKALIVRVSGSLDGYRTSWQAETDERIDQGNGNVILNLSRATFIDSRGLGYVFSLHKRLNASGRRLLLVVTSDDVGDAFEAAGVTTLLRIHSSESLAKDAL